MKISAMIAQLQAVAAEHGDIEVRSIKPAPFPFDYLKASETFDMFEVGHVEKACQEFVWTKDYNDFTDHGEEAELLDGPFLCIG